MRTRELKRKEIWAIQREWRAVFARRLHRVTGRWARGADRYVFDPRYVAKYLSGAAAENEYSLASAETVYVIEDGGLHGEVYDCRSGEKPNLSHYDERRGVLIFPDDFSWTVSIGADYSERVCFTYGEWVDDYPGHGSA